MKRIVVYWFVFPDDAVYVGLTAHPKKRLCQHMTSRTSPIKKHIDQIGLEPFFEVLTPRMSEQEAARVEIDIQSQCIKLGYKPLFNPNMGGFLGQIPARRWTKQACIESARKFSTRYQWRKGDSGAYQVAHREGWINECCPHMPSPVARRKTPWSKEECIKSARNFQSVSSWRKGGNGAYQAAYKKGWLEDCCSHMRRVSQPVRWTKESCMRDAMMFDSPNTWRKKSSGYKAAKRMGCLNEICRLMPRVRHIHWTKESCVVDARRFSSSSQWKNNSGGAYRAAKRLGCFDECCAHMSRSLRKMSA